MKESATLDRLENDCLERLCSGVESADKVACLALLERLRQYDELEKTKRPTFVSGCAQPELVQYLKERRLYVNEPVESEDEE